jgi:hypothetical protein
MHESEKANRIELLALYSNVVGLITRGAKGIHHDLGIAAGRFRAKGQIVRRIPD